MKKKLLTTIGITAIAASTFALGVYAASDIKLLINGKTVDSPVEIIDGSSYVPLRVVSEALGAEVKWDGDSRTISISNGKVEAPKSNAKSYDVKVNVESGPMKMNISKVTLDPAYQKDKYYDPINAIILDVTTENTSEDKLSWYPHAAKLVLNTKEQVERGNSLQSDQVGGEFIGKVLKTGKVVFEVKGDLKDVTSFSYVLDSPVNAETYKSVGQEKTVEVVLK